MSFATNLEHFFEQVDLLRQAYDRSRKLRDAASGRTSVTDGKLPIQVVVGSLDDPITTVPVASLLDDEAIGEVLKGAQMQANARVLDGVELAREAFAAVIKDAEAASQQARAAAKAANG